MRTLKPVVFQSFWHKKYLSSVVGNKDKLSTPLTSYFFQYQLMSYHLGLELGRDRIMSRALEFTEGSSVLVIPVVLKIESHLCKIYLKPIHKEFYSEIIRCSYWCLITMKFHFSIFIFGFYNSPQNVSSSVWSYSIKILWYMQFL